MAASLASSACATTGKQEPAIQMTPEIATEIEGACRLPAGTLAGQVPLDNVSANLECVMGEAKKRNVVVGFISNPADL